MLDEFAKAKTLADAIYAVAAKRPTAPTRAPSEGLHVVVFVGPGGGLQLTAEVALVKSALLYADHVTLVSPTVSLVTAARFLAEVSPAQEADILLDILPSIADARTTQAIKEIIALRTRKNKGRREILQAQKFETMVSQTMAQVRSAVDELVEQAGARELDEAIKAGLLTVDPLHLQATVTDELVDVFTARIQTYLQRADAYPMFDDSAGALVRAGREAGFFQVPRPTVDRVDELGLGGGLIARLPPSLLLR